MVGILSILSGVVGFELTFVAARADRMAVAHALFFTNDLEESGELLAAACTYDHLHLGSTANGADPALVAVMLRLLLGLLRPLVRAAALGTFHLDCLRCGPFRVTGGAECPLAPATSSLDDASRTWEVLSAVAAGHEY